MTRRLIGYPTGWTLAVLDDENAARAAERELAGSGIAADDLVLLAGPEGPERLDRLGTSAGLSGRIRRTVQFMTMDQLPDLHVYEQAVSNGRPVIGIRVADADARRAAVDRLRRHGAHFINRFGAWATEEIAPWRGPPPDLPDHLRR
jgi:hypothetical protein